MSLKWEAFRKLYFMIFLAYHVHNNNYYARSKPKKSIIIIIMTDIINIQKKSMTSRFCKENMVLFCVLLSTFWFAMEGL